MCRFVAYHGHPILLDDVLVKPVNSLINQSFHARESVEPLNGDGFGLGWYDHSIDSNPGIFKSIRPAWNNMNLVHLAKKIKSSCFFAHVRAASEGGVSGTNCHPFYYQDLMFMHNGGVGEFQKLKRFCRRQLDDDIYEWVKGQTDSEHVFATFLQQMRMHKLDASQPMHLLEGLQHTFATIQDQQTKFQITSNALLNVVISNGKTLIASRYVTDNRSQPRTLYYSMGESFTYRDGACHMEKSNGNNGAVLIVSEKLNDYKAEWHAVPNNHCVVVDQHLQVTLHPL